MAFHHLCNYWLWLSTAFTASRYVLAPEILCFWVASYQNGGGPSLEAIADTDIQLAAKSRIAHLLAAKDRNLVRAVIG